ncbi:hypothetical protein [Pseudomonas sp. 31-12]|uniref:gp53-like domain-containing protein n=1 Tax=Pseudomonas sp. 31-12 TaxID=2201356 RepID=UPI0026B4EAE7
MDYPNSVPSAGLVNGKFVDENPLAGTPGSLIPASWGNSVTEEILTVIRAGALTPSEGDDSQLKQAISKLISDKVPGSASELISGVLKLATQAQVTAGTDDATAITPKKLKSGFTLYVNSYGNIGYLAFPSWLGGFVIQWGAINSLATDVITTLPVSFNSQFMSVVVCNGYTASSGSIGYVAASPYTQGSFVSRGSSPSLGGNFIALGR